MTSAPWLKFYPTDWRAKPALRLCSAAARGLWLEMLCLMHDAEPRGHLLVMGHSVTPEELAGLVSIPPDECERLVAELERFKIFSRTPAGVIVSRRMVRDTAKAAAARENGRLGGNPELKAEVNPVGNRVEKPQKPEGQKAKAKKQKEPKPTPLSQLLKVLDTTRAAALVEHRQKSRHGKLTAHSAGLLAAELAYFADPNAAADLLMKKGWASINPGWSHGLALAPTPAAESAAGSTVWISGDDAIWPLLAARYLEERGRSVGPISSRHHSGQGWHFPAEWVREIRKEKP